MIRDLFAIFKTFTKTERLVFYSAGLLFAVALIFAGVIFFYQNTTVQPATGGQYTEGLVGQPIAINPVISANNDPDRDLIELIFADLEVLMERYATSTSGKELTVTLKPELKWSDNEPITADDIIFTMETIQNPDADSSLLNTWQGIVTERLSEREVRFTIKSPYIYFLDTVKSLKLIPRHIFEAIPAANLRLSSFNLEPISSGPYMYDSSKKEKSGFFSSYKFTANPNFTLASPHIPIINVNFFQTYKDALDAFNRKEIDGLGGLAPAQVEEIKIVNQIWEFKIPRYYAVFFNPNSAPILKDAAVRAALSQAVNKKKIINAIFANHALLVEGPILPYIEGYDQTVYQSKEFSLEAASSTLEKNGWLMGEDGTRSKKTKNSSQKLELELVVPQIPFLVETAELIKTDWQAIGADITLTVLPPLDINASIITSRSYQMILFGNIVRGNADIFSFWHSSQKFQPGLNLAMYENERSDELLETIRTAPDEDERLKAISSLQAQILADQPAIFLYSPNYLYASPRDLGGLTAPFINTAAERFKNINEWYLKTTRVFD